MRSAPVLCWYALHALLQHENCRYTCVFACIPPLEALYPSQRHRGRAERFSVSPIGALQWETRGLAIELLKLSALKASRRGVREGPLGGEPKRALPPSIVRGDDWRGYC